MSLVSIVTATFNSESHILDTYASIRSQSHDRWEWIITDDCSIDNTPIILKEIAAQDSRVKVFFNPINSGAAVSRNRSLVNVSGQYIAFLDSDDLWDYRKLERQIAFMTSGIDFSFTAYELIDEHGKAIGQVVDASHSGAFSYEDMLKKKATLGCSTVMLRREAFQEISMPLLRTGQDYAAWLKLLKTGKKAYLLNEALTKYRIRPGSISRNKVKKARRQWEIYRDVEQMSLLKSATCFSFYAWRVIFRK